MATPFESFVQLELPKRPYAEVDGDEESLLVRRGPGPRQLDFVALSEGQVVAKIGGKIVGTSMSGGAGALLYTHKQEVAHSTWNVVHGCGSSYFTVSIYSGGRMILPDEVQIEDDNTVTIKFLSLISGHAVFFFDPNA